MKDAQSVITHVTHGITDKLAAEYEVSLPRMYEILGKDCVYPKAKRLIRKIGRLNMHGARLIKADLDAMFNDIFADEVEMVTAVDLHREAFEAVNATLEHKSKADRKQELRELITVAEMMLEGVDREDVDIREMAKCKTFERFAKVNGNGGR